MATPLEFIIEGDDRSSQAFGSLNKNLKKTDKKSKDLLGTFAKTTIIARGVVAAFRAASKATAGMFSAAQKQVNVEIQLAAALAKSGQEVKNNLTRLKDFASARQQVTTFGDEVTLTLAKVGAEFGLTVDEIERVVPAVQDRALQAGRAPLDMMRIAAKSLTGISQGWTELGVVIDKTGNRQDKFNSLVKQMRSGVSEAIGSLPISQLDKLGNSFGDLLEKVGMVIVATGTFQGVVKLVGRGVDFLNNALSDPKALKAAADFIDKLIVGWLKWQLQVPKIILRGMAAIVTGLEVVATTMAQIATKIVTVLIKGFALVVKAVDAMVPSFLDANGQLKKTATNLSALSDEMATWEVKVTGGADAINSLADGLDRAQTWIGAFVEQAKPAMSLMDDLIDRFQKMSEANAALTAGPSDAQIAEIEAFVEQARAAFEEAGTDLASVFSGAMQDAFSKDVGYKEAFRNLGGDMRELFTGQFSDAAFAPLKAQFGQLATALAQPFQIVGTIAANILRPLTNLVTQVISTIVTELLSVIGLQELAAATGIAGIAATSAAASGLGAAWGAAATAAAIATLGAALAAAPAAQAAIVAGAAQTRALSVPLAEGGIVSPSPGGTQATIGEGGEAELVAPLSDLPEILRRAGIGGAGGGVNVTLEAGTVVLSGDDAEDNLAALGEAFSDELRRAQDFANFQRSVVLF